MKQYCEECQGQGYSELYLEWNSDLSVQVPCDVCEGKGYIEITNKDETILREEKLQLLHIFIEDLSYDWSYKFEERHEYILQLLKELKLCDVDYTIKNKSDEFKDAIDLLSSPEIIFDDWEEYVNFVPEYDL